MSNSERIEVLSALGGEIAPEDMNEYPTFSQWSRYWLMRMEWDDAIFNAHSLFIKKSTRPRIDNDDGPIAYRI